ncbi:MAG: NUDIX hydrolase [Caldilineaceae bacterium]
MEDIRQIQPMRHTRYQGAIIQDDKILLIRHTDHADGRSYWVIPGGGREDGETEEACVAREMWEETNLVVQVERLLVEMALPHDPFNKVRKSYLCTIIAGEAAPGYEPEEDAAHYAITEVAWFDLRAEDHWEPSIFTNPIAYPVIQEIRRVLGYL